MRLPWRVPSLQPEPLARAAVVGAMVSETIQRQGWCTWRAWGHSMAPAIAHGDVLRLVEAVEFDVGDVVMASIDDDHLVVHRVRHIDSAGMVELRGDSCVRPDPSVHRSRVLARVTPTPQSTLRSAAYDLSARLTGAVTR